MIRSRWLVSCAALAGVIAMLVLRLDPTIGDQTSAAPTADGPTGPSMMSVAEEQATAGVLVDRVQLFRTGNLGPRFRLNGSEMTALLRHAAPGMIPAGVSDPVVQVLANELQVEARVARHDVLPPRDGFSLPDLLPDTVRVVVRGVVTNGVGDRIVFTVLGARVGRIPLPRSVVAAVVAELPGGSAGPDEDEAPWTSDGPTIAVRAPAGIGDVSIAGEEVVFYRIEPFVDRAVDGSDP